MTLDDDFRAAQARVNKLSRLPATDELLELYALYKQATKGDAEGKRPGLLDPRGRAKWDAWKRLEGTGAEAAMERYVALVAALERAIGVSG